MSTLNFLHSRDIKKIKQILQQQFGYALQGDYAFVQNEKNRIFIVTRDVAKMDFKKLVIERFGLYLGEWKNTQFRLSKEGAFFFVREARANKAALHNVVSLTMEEVKSYFRGDDLMKNLGVENRLVLLEFNSDILGCAAYKEGKMINFLPKIHRGEVII